MHSVLRIPALLLSAAFPFFASCSRGETEAAPAERAETARKAAAPSSAQASPAALEPTLVEPAPAQRARTRSEELADAYDPERDEWESEARAVGLMRRLDALGALIAARREPTEADAAALAAEDVACDPLVPTGLEAVRESGPFALRRWPRGAAGEDAALRGPAGLVEALKGLRAVLRPGELEVETEFQVIGLKRADDGVDARVLVSAWGRGAGGSTQQEASWLCRFVAAGEGEDPRLARIALEAYQDGRLDGLRAAFEDCTATVLGGDPTFEPQVLRGLDHWLPRISQLAGMTNIGHHGLALGDVNGDGLEDLYVCDDGGLPNRLYVQQPDGTLRDTSAEAGVDWLDHSSSPLLLDLDGDGDQDLVVAMRGLLLFAQNNGEGRFASRVRIPIGVGSMSLSAADYDLDGDLDVYCCMYNAHPESEGIAFPYHRAENGAENLFLRNAGGFRFVDATEEAGLSVNNTRFSFAAAWQDYDDDGDQDLYIANDFGLNNLYRNDGGRFTDVAVEARVEDIASGMSADWGDYDRDGHPDIYVGNLYSPAGMRVTENDPFAQGKSMDAVMDVRRMARGNTLYRALGDGSFRDTSVEAGVNRGRWAWASPFVDLDGDGWEDLVVANGYYTFEDPRDLDSFFWRHVVYRSPKSQPTEREIEEYRTWWLAMTNLVKQRRSYNGNERNCAFLNLRDGSFADVSALSGADFPEDARSIAVTDWDADGDLDLWVRNRTGPRLRLLSNRLGPAGGEKAFVAFHLRGTTANRDAIGARVELELEGDAPPLRRALQAGTGFLGQSSKWVHFGLGGARVAGVRVRWPGGETEAFEGVEAGRRYTLVQGSGRAEAWERPGGPVRIEPAPIAEPAETELAAVFLPARFPAPILRCIPDGAAQPAEIELGAKPLLVFLWARWSAPSIAALEELARRAPELAAAGLEVLALDASEVARPSQGSASPASGAEALLASADFPFRRGRATVELLDKLAVLQEYLFDLIPRPCLPFGVLIDGEGEVSGLYRGGPEVDALLRHVDLLDELIERRYELGMPLPGRWKILATDAGPMTAANWFIERYPEDAARYYERVIESGGGGSASPAPSDGRVDPGRARALARLAELRLRERRLEDAIRLLRESIELDPTQAGALRDLADAELFHGEVEAAIEHYGRSIELDPRSTAAHVGLGNALKRAGRGDDAVRAFEAALAVDPAHPDANVNLGIALTERQRVDEAVECFARAVGSAPERAPSHYLLGGARAMRGETEAANASYRRAMELDASFVDLHLGRGEGYLQGGRTGEALAHFDLVLELRPDSAKAWLLRARARAQAGETELARSDAQRAEELADDPALRAQATQLLGELE